MVINYCFFVGKTMQILLYINLSQSSYTLGENWFIQINSVLSPVFHLAMWWATAFPGLLTWEVTKSLINRLAKLLLSHTSLFIFHWKIQISSEAMWRLNRSSFTVRLPLHARQKKWVSTNTPHRTPNLSTIFIGR